MKHRLLAAIFCVCLALTSLCAPALADGTEPETPVPAAETPVPAAETPVPAEETPAPVPVVYGERSTMKINDEYIELNTYYKVDPTAAVGYSKAAEGEDYNFIYDGGTLVLKDTVLMRSKVSSTLLSTYSRSTTIELIGENRFTVQDINSSPIIAANVTIRGDGSLTLVGGITAINRLTMESGTFVTDFLRPATFSPNVEKYVRFNGGSFTVRQRFGGDGNSNIDFYIGVDYYKWKTDLNAAHTPSFADPCPDPNGNPLSIVPMENPFQSRLRINPYTKEW